MRAGAGEVRPHIRLERVTKYYGTRRGSRRVLDEVSFELERGGHLGILGRNGAGKSTLIRLLSGAEYPSSGRIHRHMSVSWPLAFTGAFQAHLTGIDNLKFVCRVYGVDWKPLLPFVEEFTELGIYLREPVLTYSTGMMMRLAFALSMAIEFDCFLIDEGMAVGDSRFGDRCHVELFEKRRDRSFILVSHDPHIIRMYCNRVAVLDEGRLIEFDTIDAAYEYYDARQQLAPPAVRFD